MSNTFFQGAKIFLGGLRPTCALLVEILPTVDYLETYILKLPVGPIGKIHSCTPPQRDPFKDDF